MNKKVFLLPITFILLTSCNQGPYPFLPFGDQNIKDSLCIDDDNDIYYQKKNHDVLHYPTKDINSLRDVFNDLKNNRPRHNLSTQGKKNLLVLPISFIDSDKSNLDAKTTLIQNAFFGQEQTTEYESVASYYYKSSYGQFLLGGEVASWYHLDIKINDWKNISTNYTSTSNIIVSRAVDYLKENNLIDFSKYDLDQDGYIDAIYAIYDAPLAENYSSSLYWAYSYSIKEKEFNYNLTAPYANIYSWSSIECLDQGHKKVNTNYLLHETGHLLGLEDYYNTNYYVNSQGLAFDYHYQPTGGFDMMDYNVGDHNPFSKYLLSWISPKILKRGINTKITLKPFNESGECLLVPASDFNNTPYSEYLLLEYFSPTGLNDIDDSFSYYDKYGNKRIFNYPSFHGLRIYHINARLGYFAKENSSGLIALADDPKIEEIIKDKNVVISYAYSNTLLDSQANNNHPVLCHLLESSGNNTFINGMCASNDTLFRRNDDFGITKFVNYQFSNNEIIPFTFKVNNATNKGITITVKSK